MRRLKFEVVDYTQKNKTDDTFPVVGPLSWDIQKGITITLGRHEEHRLKQNSILFKNKVISRHHAEIWQDENEKVYIKDIGSSTGTFLNSTRLSSENEVSEPMELKHGDILRLGTNYHGGLQAKHRCTILQVILFDLAELNKYAVEDCGICLFGINTGQAIFVTPCRHLFHYKCCKPLLITSVFCCPLCREKNNLLEN